MIKRILVTQDGSSYGRAALDAGLWLAKGFQASLTGLYVVDIVFLEGPFLHDISASIGFEPLLNFSAKMQEVLLGRGKDILSSFDEACRSSSVPSESLAVTGIVTNEICDQARLSDLVIVGRKGVNEKFEHGLLGAVTEGVIRKSPRPVLVVPAEFKAPQNPLLAYDGSPNASKAMHSAAEWAKALGSPLTVAAVSKEGKAGEALFEAEKYLKPYGISVKLVPLSGDPPDAMERYARENKHDLIFMGVCRHPRLIEMVLGSAAEHLIRSL
ncbi:MAG: universal stress protein [Deltaproteobacteria bacterium]|nr:universal stress protein [Deltaproteobacteria bacterium]